MDRVRVTSYLALLLAILVVTGPAPFGAEQPESEGCDTRSGLCFAVWRDGGTRSYSVGRAETLQRDVRRSFDPTLHLRDATVMPGDAFPDSPRRFRQAADKELFLLQFKTASLAPWRETLRRMGVEVQNFVPGNAHVVRIPDGGRAEVEALSFVQRVEPLHPWYRLGPGLRDWVLSPVGNVRRFRVVVTGHRHVRDTAIVALAQEAGARLISDGTLGSVLELEGNHEALAKIVAHDDVLWIDASLPMTTSMNQVREDSGAVWLEQNATIPYVGACGQEVRGEVADNGIDASHIDFDNQGVAGFAGLLAHGPIPDLAFHGTNTYGILFGNGDKDLDGDARALGLLHCAEQGIFAQLEVGGLPWNGRSRYIHVQELLFPPYQAIFQSVSGGSNDSDYGNSTGSYAYQADQIVHELDISLLQAMGNKGNDNIQQEAVGKNVISVGGIRHGDMLDPTGHAWCDVDCNTLYDGDEPGCITAADCWWDVGHGSCGRKDDLCATTGPTADGRIKPDLAYWHDAIFTTNWFNPDQAPEYHWYRPEFGGTSAATPQVAGALGLIVQLWARDTWNTSSPGITVFDKRPHAATVKALLINNATQWDFSGTEHELRRVRQGWGRPNVRTAKERAARSVVIDEAISLEQAAVASFLVDVAPAETELRVTMAYTDLPGTLLTTRDRINNLDLFVQSPTGLFFHGNHGLLEGNFSAPGGVANTVDTVENVFVEDPMPGVWRLFVIAEEIAEDQNPLTPEDDANFALVVTGAVTCSADDDQDSICDTEDNCPAVANPTQDDDDLDGIGNACDGCVGADLGITPGPIAFWPAEYSANDVAGGNPGGSINGVDFVPGRVGQAFSFDRADGSYVYAGSMLDDLAYPFSVTAWIQLASAGANPILTSHDPAFDGDAYLGVWIDVGADRYLYASTGDGGSAAYDNRVTRRSAAQVALGAWTHVAVVVPAHGQTDIYLNGVLSPGGGGSSPGSGGAMSTTSSYPNLYPARIGRNRSSRFNGLIDELAVFDRALTDTEIESMYQSSTGLCVPGATCGNGVREGLEDCDGLDVGARSCTSLGLGTGTVSCLVETCTLDTLDCEQPACATPSLAPVAWMTGDEQTLDIATTSSGTLLNGAGFGDGLVGPAFALDGVDDYVDFGDVLNSVELPITVEGWVHTPLGHTQIVLHTDQGASSYRGFWVELNPQGLLITHFGTGTGTGSGDRNSKVSVGRVAPSEWTHLAAVIHEFRNIDIYLNGHDVDGEYSGTGSAMQHSGAPLRLGIPGFEGLIDEITVFDEALSLGELQAIVGAGRAGKCGKELVCDGLDDNGNGLFDEGCDDDGDGFCDERLEVVGTPAVCSNGALDCNDASVTSYPGAAEVCDALDNDCDGLVELVAPGEITGLRWLDKATLTWDSDAPTSGNATLYDLMCGDVQDLFFFGTGQDDRCLADDLDVLLAPDTAPEPLAGRSWFYLVRGQNVCGTGRYETATDGSDRLTDVCP